MPSFVARCARVGAAALCALAMPGALQAQTEGDVAIYTGQTSQTAGLKLLSWGSGTAKDSEESVFTGVRSLRVTTHGLFQGARLVLGQPANVKAGLADPSAYLRLTVKTAEKNSTMRMGMGGPGGMAMPGGAGMVGMKGMSGGGSGRAGRGFGDYSNAVMGKPKALANVRLLVSTTDGKTAETVLSYADAKAGDEDWRTLAVPLSALAGLKDSNGQIAEIGIFGDTPTTLFVGEIRTVRDETPIRIEEMNERTVAVNDEITFTGDAEGGVSPLKYEWTFANAGEFNASSALPVDSEGRTIKHRFRKSGDYEVFLVVRDLNGNKKPAVAKAKVHVTL